MLLTVLHLLGRVGTFERTLFLREQFSGVVNKVRWHQNKG